MASPPPTSSPNHSLPENTTNNHQHHLHPLPCPRCNSSNTKFCYYNNYSLSQPRHFCKACKRYWTRGGTLRNVPVGGGCRKNKRQKRPSSSASTANPKIDLPAQPTSNPLFYTNPSEPLEFPFSGFRSTRVCGDSHSGFDFQPQVNGLGLGFSSGLMAAANHHEDELSKSQPFSSGHDHSIFYGASSGFASSSTSTMASLLASTFHHPKFGANGGGPSLMSYEEMGKDLKLEGDQNGLGWNSDPNPNPNYYSDPTSLLGAWFDPSNSNMGSSVPSLI